MILLLARRAELEVRRDDDKCKSLRSTKNRFGLSCHPLLCLMAETRPILLEDHLYALRLVGKFHIKVDFRVPGSHQKY